MTTKIRCTTLFNITKTGVPNRRTPAGIPQEKVTEWEKNRNSQSNFDTIIQVLSLRTQPEDISTPVQDIIVFNEADRFGFLFENEEAQPIWTFDFTVNYDNVYSDGINDLGALYSDCDGVPMIKNLGEWSKLPNFLDSSAELRNIHFEII